MSAILDEMHLNQQEPTSQSKLVMYIRLWAALLSQLCSAGHHNQGGVVLGIAIDRA